MSLTHKRIRDQYGRNTPGGFYSDEHRKETWGTTPAADKWIDQQHTDTGSDWSQQVLHSIRQVRYPANTTAEGTQAK